MANKIVGNLDAGSHSFAIVVSRFSDLITERLAEGARDALQRHGASDENITEIWVPGAWELPLAVEAAAASGKYQAIVALGCVIRGATPHFEYVAGEATKGVAGVSLRHGLPVTLGVLTTDTLEQAIERAGSKAGNKGVDAAVAAVEMVNLLAQLRA